MTGHGGWPMTVFATPDGQPFYCGTYFPPRPAHGMPAFRQVLAAVTEAWTTRRAELEAGRHADRRGHLRAAGPRRAGAAVTAERARRRRRRARPRLRRRAPAASAARRSSRRRWCWSSCCARTPAPATPRPLRMARGTLRGDGPRRHLRPAGRRVRPVLRRRRLGGAALREDALRQRPAAAGLPRTSGGRPATAWARRVADETAAFLLRDLGTPEGGFASALDADTDGRRGPHLRLDAGPADRGARRRTTAGGRPTLFAVTDARHVRARHARPCSCCATPTTRRGWPSVRERLLAARARAAAAGPRRQGGHRLERPGDRRAGRARRR